MRKITLDEQFREAVAASEVTVAVFKATWCSDCHFIDAFMPEVEQKYSGRIQLVEIDVEDIPELSSELNILGIPSFVAFREGKELVRFVNKLRKSREEIEQFLDRALEVSAALQN